MVRSSPPHAILISGPPGVGTTTLGLDLAAALLCTAEDPADRPCRSCRACRLIEHGDHPDLHRLEPEGAGRNVVIGEATDPAPNSVRGLLVALALLPLEGGARVGLIEAADRMTEAAQGALLKTLEEPGQGVTFILCAEREDALLPTIRSRCARIRLGPLAARDVEAILAEQAAADAPTAARLARIVGGNARLALAYARAHEADRRRGELVRTMLDLTTASPSTRLATIRTAMSEAIELAKALEAADHAGAASDAAADARPPTKRGRTGAPRRATAPAPTAAAPATPDGSEDPDDDVDETAAKGPPTSVRRRAAELMIGAAIDAARDLVLVGLGDAAATRDPAVLEDLRDVARGLPAGAAATALARAERAARLLAGNVSPELVLDDLALAWPRTTAAGRVA